MGFLVHQNLKGPGQGMLKRVRIQLQQNICRQYTQKVIKDTVRAQVLGSAASLLKRGRQLKAKTLVLWNIWWFNPCHVQVKKDLGARDSHPRATESQTNSLTWHKAVSCVRYWERAKKSNCLEEYIIYLIWIWWQILDAGQTSIPFLKRLEDCR